jgi:pyridoxamine 5'-phosphate oxidase
VVCKEKTSRNEIRKALRVKEDNDVDIAKWTWEKAVTKIETTYLLR